MSDHKQHRRTRILAAAADLFAQLGFDGTSMGAVAELAGVKKSLIQYHFASKEILWQAAVHHIWSKRNNALPQYLDQLMLAEFSELDQRQTVSELCKKLLKFTFDHPQWVNIMMQQAAIPGPRLDWMIETFFKEDFAKGKAMIELAQSRHQLPQVDAMDLLHILSGALIYLVNVAPITERVMGVSPSSERYINRHIGTLMAILNGTGND
ncbi:HTH-type transcriptional regulator RutR [Sinobacterium norvegicum]|uniref:HTH-type transcriptional regulator RutR n=1 Tax=Sinobacterium norvegicum TaxID=1641715 RepID=A0ABN8EJF6_9GAMM|nr:TetR/AcrR family transcriptional regulator [Sinobacterium norvegicum]CAH0992534.1 HTH-type transcriptional regulator RutR [Sinobacterium norvegicum]